MPPAVCVVKTMSNAVLPDPATAVTDCAGTSAADGLYSQTSAGVNEPGSTALLNVTRSVPIVFVAPSRALLTICGGPVTTGGGDAGGGEVTGGGEVAAPTAAAALRNPYAVLPVSAAALSAVPVTCPMTC